MWTWSSPWHSQRNPCRKLAPASFNHAPRYQSHAIQDALPPHSSLSWKTSSVCRRSSGMPDYDQAQALRLVHHSLQRDALWPCKVV